MIPGIRLLTNVYFFFTLQKSPYGGYYENLMGCFLKELNTTGKEYPAFNKNDLGYCIENFVDKELVRSVFDLKNCEFEEYQREFYINEFFELYVLPFLNDVSTKEGIKQAITKYEDLIYYVKGRTRTLLLIKVKALNMCFLQQGLKNMISTKEYLYYNKNKAEAVEPEYPCCIKLHTVGNHI